MSIGTPTHRARAADTIVSIGLPVRNAEDYLAEALEAITGQTHRNLEVVISDNASTDETEAICRAAMEGDPRIRYVRNRANIGAAPNFNQTFRLSTGAYFKFAAHDDLISPTLVEECVTYLDDHPSVVLCHSAAVPINEHGAETGPPRWGPAVDAARPSDRFATMMRHPFWATPLFGVVRSEVLDRTRLLGPYLADDHVLLSELSLLGAFHELEKPSYYQRDYPGRELHKQSWSARLAFASPGHRGAALPRIRLIDGYRRAVQHIGPPQRERVRCYAAIGGWVGQRAIERVGLLSS